jgi:hypothetical protein
MPTLSARSRFTPGISFLRLLTFRAGPDGHDKITMMVPKQCSGAQSPCADLTEMGEPGNRGQGWLAYT